MNEKEGPSKIPAVPLFVPEKKETFGGLYSMGAKRRLAFFLVHFILVKIKDRLKKEPQDKTRLAIKLTR